MGALFDILVAGITVWWWQRQWWRWWFMEMMVCVLCVWFVLGKQSLVMNLLCSYVPCFSFAHISLLHKLPCPCLTGAANIGSETCQHWSFWLWGLRAFWLNKVLRVVTALVLGQGSGSLVGTDCRCQSVWKMAVLVFASSWWIELGWNYFLGEKLQLYS